MTPLQLAGIFHDTYERLAPSFGYVTRPETREFRPASPNGQLMIAVCQELLDQYDLTPRSVLSVFKCRRCGSTRKPFIIRSATFRTVQTTCQDCGQIQEPCQRCGSDRAPLVTFCTAPEIAGTMTTCLSCGQVQGEWPVSVFRPRAGEGATSVAEPAKEVNL